VIRPFIALAMLCVSAGAAAAAETSVTRRTIEDRKAVIATVEPVHELVARARIGGTVSTLSVKEGNSVAAGDRVALVADQKLQLQIAALQSRIQAQQAERDQAQNDFSRASELRRTGTGTQVALDQAKTRLDVAERNLAALRTDRQVIEQQSTEGAVLAPGAGRVLGVPVSEGSVVLSGETIAAIAADNYILRLQLPERHARFIKTGDIILIGGRGLQAEGPEMLHRGHVTLVYPQIDQGRVIADVVVEGLGDYFVGERTRIYIGAGAREALVIPEDYVYRRFGVSYAKLADGTEIAIQLGLPVEGGIEVLAGLRDGDRVVAP
jgi:membrane fusion protein, multidrug efflux system